MRASLEREAVVGARRKGPGRKPVFEQRRVKEIAGIVAGKGSAGAVGALQTGRKPDDQEPRVDRPEGGYRRVEPVRLRARARSRGRQRAADSAGNRVRTLLPRGAPPLPAHGRQRDQSLVEFVVVIGAHRRPRGRRAALQELRRVLARLAAARGPAVRTLAGVAADLGLQFGNVEEHVGLAAQFVGDHGRLGRYGRCHGDPDALALHRLDQRTEIAVAGKQHHVVDLARRSPWR